MNIAYPAQLDKYQAIAAAISLLAKLYPKCFSVYEVRRRPLKLGIHLDIQAGLDGAMTPAELHTALGAYCSNPAYLGHTRKGAWRLDLNGEPAGVVTAEEEAHAKARLASIKARKAKAQAPTARRLSLADLKAAALARKAGAQREVSQQEINHAQNATSRRCNRRPEAR